MPQGALLHRLFRCLTLHHAWATRIRERLRHLLLKKVPWLQGARPLDVTHRVWCPRGKKEAPKKSPDLKKVLPCSLHQCNKTVSRHAKILCCPWRQWAGTTKSKPRVSKGL